MEITTPDYYHRFRCIAGRCPDSCCKEWDVQVDDASAAYYRGLPGALGDRLRQVLSETEDGVVMVNENGRCPMWRSDGLCRIQAELGEEALCQVCSRFPRLYHDYGDFAEEGLELSCPEAARLILDSTSCRLETRCAAGGEDGEYDEEIMEILKRSRQKAFAILDDPAYCVADALTLLLMYGYQVQGELDGGEPVEFDPSMALEEARGFAQAGNWRELADFYQELEILTPQWRDWLARETSPVPWCSQLRAMARYLVLRYWYQAVADFDLVCRVKLVIVSCLRVKGLGGDIYRAAQLYSKEIENNTDNLEAILDAAYTHPALTDAKLLYMLQEQGGE